MKNNRFGSKMKKLFPFFRNRPHALYFDNAATTLKPSFVTKAITNYYNTSGVTDHSNDNEISNLIDDEVELARQKIANFINGEKNEISFVSSTTFAINYVACFLSKTLNKGDEILTTKYEHASNIVPLLRLQTTNAIKVNFLELTEETAQNIKRIDEKITPKTKFISLTPINNSNGMQLDILSLTNEIKKKHPSVLILLDCAQAITQKVFDVKTMMIDFLAFSGHKIFGPTGIGVLWINQKWHHILPQFIIGSRMYSDLTLDNEIKYLNYPYLVEAGTKNIAGIIGISKAIEFCVKYQIPQSTHSQELRKYFIDQWKKKQNHLKHKIIIYQPDLTSTFILFNVHKFDAHEVAKYLSYHQIYVRAGSFCIPFFHEIFKTPKAIRISFSIYNTFNEIDYFWKVINSAETFLEHIIR